MKSKKTIQSIESTMMPKANHYLSCLEFAKVQVRRYRKSFTSENIINRYNELNLPTPLEPRVWGSVMLALQRNGLIYSKGEFVAYKGVKGNGKPSRVWYYKSKTKQSC